MPSLYRTSDEQSPRVQDSITPGLLRLTDECNEDLRLHPYDPEIWLRRAECFLKLNYPELAAGDAYKAVLLLDRARQDHDLTATRESPDNEVQSKAYEILGQALFDCHCHSEAADVWEEVTRRGLSNSANDRAARLRQLLERKAKSAASLGGTAQEQRDRIRDGGVLTVSYPWVERRHLTRSAELVATVNEELRCEVRNRPCYVGVSTLANSSNVLGMFAAREISSGECILFDRTATAACSTTVVGGCDNCYGRIIGVPTHARCCSTRYCSLECHDMAMNTYHIAMCKHDFEWLSKPASGLRENGSPLRALIMLRFLATCVQASGQRTPLDHPLIARLQPLVDRGHLDVFTFSDSIVTPIRILEQLGVDVFSNPNFDTMIVHTIWTRIANNKAGSVDETRGFIDGDHTTSTVV